MEGGWGAIIILSAVALMPLIFDLVNISLSSLRCEKHHAHISALADFAGYTPPSSFGEWVADLNWEGKRKK